MTQLLQHIRSNKQILEILKQIAKESIDTFSILILHVTQFNSRDSAFPITTQPKTNNWSTIKDHEIRMLVLQHRNKKNILRKHSVITR